MLFDEIVNDAYGEREYPALLALAREWAQTRPFDGLRVLAATPVFRNTLLQYRALLAGGADLIVGVAGSDVGDGRSSGAGMPCAPGIVEVLRGNGIPVIGLQEAFALEAAGRGFDLVLDCAGQFSACHPRFGFVELTRSGVQVYENSEHPVYVADSGIVKRIETCLGTGEGYVRALAQLGYDYCLDSGADGAGKKFVVFGSGKVGQGIVLQLLRSGANVQVVTDCSRGSCAFLDANDVPVMDCNDLDGVAALVRDADFVVTATGVKGALDVPELTAALVESRAVLANMGVEDEYGPGVPATRVLAEKKPLNFILEEPTHLKYIDASLALHAALGELLLREACDVYSGKTTAAASKKAGPMDPPSELEQRILSMTMQDGLIGPEIAEMMGW
jgi:adenosylhomocysteinase